MFLSLRSRSYVGGDYKSQVPTCTVVVHYGSFTGTCSLDCIPVFVQNVLSSLCLCTEPWAGIIWKDHKKQQELPWCWASWKQIQKLKPTHLDSVFGQIKQRAACVPCSPNSNVLIKSKASLKTNSTIKVNKWSQILSRSSAHSYCIHKWLLDIWRLLERIKQTENKTPRFKPCLI